MDDLRSSDYQALAEFRHQIRRFLHFSEAAARAEGLEPQQHQMLLAIRTWRDRQGEPDVPNMGELAEHLLLKHHSAVGLVDRLAERGLVERLRVPGDRRYVRVQLTALGRDKLKHLSSTHYRELRESGPILVRALNSLLKELVPDGPTR
jgi:DNA-binding MarR family transcriptional regulator